MATAAAPQQKFDILVAGAGASGLIAAIALARAGHSIALVGKTPGPLPGRTVALFEGSLRHLDDLGLREPLEEISAVVKGIRILEIQNRLMVCMPSRRGPDGERGPAHRGGAPDRANTDSRSIRRNHSRKASAVQPSRCTRRK